MLAAPLTAVNLALKPFPEVAALSHVGSIISSYLDGSMLIPLDKACLMGSTRLLDRTWQSSDPKAEKVHEVSTGGGGVWGFGYREVGSRAFLRLRGDVEVVEEAARRGRMDILQYLLEYDSFEAQVDDKRNIIRWGGDDMANAIREGHGEVARWLYENTPRAPRNLDDLMKYAVRQGNMNLVQWLLDVVYEAEIWLPPPTMNDAAAGGHMEMLQWISKRYSNENSDALEGAAINGHLPMVQWLAKNKITTGAQYAVEAACEGGHLNVVRWLFKHCEVSSPHSAAKLSIEKGHLRILKYLYGTGLAYEPQMMMLDAASYGHLHVIKWLLKAYGNKLFPFVYYCPIELLSDSPMDRAASNGHFHVLKFLHALAVDMKAKEEGGGPNCTSWALTTAAAMGNLDIVKWLRKNYPTLRFSPSTTSLTANHGYLEVLQWLQQEPNVMWSSDAMDSAAENGRLSVIKWLQENRDEGCTTNAMNYAAQNGHLNVVRWLQLNRSEGFTRDAMDFPVEREHFEVLLFLRAHGSEECSTAAKLFAREHKQPHILAWLEDQYPDTGM